MIGTSIKIQYSSSSSKHQDATDASTADLLLLCIILQQIKFRIKKYKIDFTNLYSASGRILTVRSNIWMVLEMSHISGKITRQPGQGFRIRATKLR